MAGDVVTCPHCRTPMEVAGRMRGAIVNCGRCGRAVDVPGLRDPAWLLLRVLAVAAAGLVAWAVGRATSPWVGAAAGGVLLALAWLVSRAL